MEESNMSLSGEKRFDGLPYGEALHHALLGGVAAVLYRRGYSKTAVGAFLAIFVRRLMRAPFHPVSSRLLSPFVTPPGCQVGGTVADPMYKPVYDAFLENFQIGNELGSQLCIYVDGRRAVDLWGRQENHRATKKYSKDALQIVFSCTKNMTALCVAKCVDNKWLKYDDTVGSIWPEFKENGKGDITIADVLRHDAGLWCLDEQMTIAEASDPLLSAKRMAQERLHYDEIDGAKENYQDAAKEKARYYHGLTRGFILAELIRRVDPKHRFIGKFACDEICEPLGIKFYIGSAWYEMGAQEDIAPMEPYEIDVVSKVIRNAGLATLSGLMVPLASFGILNKGLTGLVNGFINLNVYGDLTNSYAKMWAMDTVVNNSARWDPTFFNDPNPGLHQCTIPSGNGISSAANMAKLSACIANGGELDGVRIFKRETIESMHSGITSKFMLAFEAPFSQGGFCKFDPAAIGRPKRRKGQKVDNDFFGWGGWGGSIWCWTSLEARHKAF
eukprot:g5702.t1